MKLRWYVPPRIVPVPRLGQHQFGGDARRLARRGSHVVLEVGIAVHPDTSRARTGSSPRVAYSQRASPVAVEIDHRDVLARPRRVVLVRADHVRREPRRGGVVQQIDPQRGRGGAAAGQPHVVRDGPLLVEVEFRARRAVRHHGDRIGPRGIERATDRGHGESSLHLGIGAPRQDVAVVERLEERAAPWPAGRRRVRRNVPSTACATRPSTSFRLLVRLEQRVGAGWRRTR